METLKVAVLGLGKMGGYHLSKYAQMENVEVVALCDRNIETVKKLSEVHNCRYFNDFEELINNCDIDAVTISASTSQHFNLAKQALNQNLHVLIEKPITETVSQATELIDLAKEKGRVLMVGHIERFNPAITIVKQLIERNEIGVIKNVICRRVSPFPSQMKDGNVLIDLAVHDIDILLYLLNDLPEEVNGFCDSVVSGLVDFASLYLKFKTLSAFIEVSWVSPVMQRTLKITGSKGTIELDYIKKEVRCYKSKISEINDGNTNVIKFEEPEDVVHNIENIDALYTEVDHFVNAVINKSEPLVSGQDGLAALKIALEVSGKYQHALTE